MVIPQGFPAYGGSEDKVQVIYHYMRSLPQEVFNGLVRDVGPGLASMLPAGARVETANWQTLAQALVTWYRRNSGVHQLLMQLGWQPPLWQKYRGQSFDSEAIIRHVAEYLVMVDVVQLCELVTGVPVETEYSVKAGPIRVLLETITAPQHGQLMMRIQRDEHPLWNET